MTAVQARALRCQLDMGRDTGGGDGWRPQTVVAGGAGDRVCRGAGHVERAGGAEGSRGRAGPIRGRAGLAPDA